MTNEKKKTPNSVTFIEKYLVIYLKIKTWKHQNHQIKNHLVNFRSMQQNRACKKINAFHVVRYLNHDGRLYFEQRKKMSQMYRLEKECLAWISRFYSRGYY